MAKGHLNKYFTNPQVVAVEMFSAGWCNLSCKYCYIAKTDFLKGIHEVIINSIKDGTLIQDIEDIYGNDIESMAHWGTEPTLTVKYFKDFYAKAIKIFPKLYQIKLSSNFMTNPDNLLKFVTEILPQDKKLSVGIQASLDGPPYITDKNRQGGSTETIINNCYTFTRRLNRIGTIHDVQMHLKPTIGADDIMTLTDFNKSLEYYEFFDDFFVKWFENNSNEVVKIMRGCDPTLVVPGEYTSTDGKAFSKFFDNQMKLQEREWKVISPPDSNYYWRYKQKLNSRKEFFSKHRMFTCSAGDTCFATGDITGTSHICHQSFYRDHPEYDDEVRKYGLDKQTMEGMESGRIDDIKRRFITTKNEEMKTIQLLYLTRAYNDFYEHKHSSSIAAILELAHAGQLDPIYKDVKMAEQFSTFLITCDCPMDNSTISGSQLVRCASLARVFGNGVHKNILKRLIKEM